MQDFATLRGLDENLRTALLRRVPADLPSVTELRRAVDATVEHTEHEARANPFLDLRTARRIARTLHWMLDDFETDADPEALRLVAAAVTYFADDLDEDPDLQGAYGFDDDARVVEAVRHALMTGV